MEENITVLVDAKIEYTKQLTNILVPFIFQGVKSIYKSTVSLCNMNQDGKILMRFQEQLSQIPKWNQEIIDEEYHRIIEDSKCDWLDDLVTAVFLSHTKILTAIKSGNKQNKINLKIPKIDHFIHKCYIESAREFWKNPYIFSDQVTHSEYQRNINDGHKIIGSCIEETIRKLLPVKNILREYLGSGFEEQNQDDSLLPDTYKENLKKMVQKELEVVKNPSAPETEILDNLDNLEEIETVDIGIKKKELAVEKLEELDLNINENNTEPAATEEQKTTEESISSKNQDNLVLEELNLEDMENNSNTESKLDSQKNDIEEEKNIEVVFEEKPPEENTGNSEILGIEELDLESFSLDSDKKMETSPESTKESTDTTEASKESTDTTEASKESTDTTEATKESTDTTEATKESTDTTEATKESTDTTEATKESKESKKLEESAVSREPSTKAKVSEKSITTEGNVVVEELNLENLASEKTNLKVDELNLDTLNLEMEPLDLTDFDINEVSSSNVDKSKSEMVTTPSVEPTTSESDSKLESISLETTSFSKTPEPEKESVKNINLTITEEPNNKPKLTDITGSKGEKVTETPGTIKPLNITEPNTIVTESMNLSPQKDLEEEGNNDIKNMKSIIKNELYQKDIDSNISDGELSEDETRIENMRFKKSGLENLDLENLESDFEIDDGELVNFQPIASQDITFGAEDNKTKENLRETKNTKTIIIGEETKKPISKYNKPKKKNFKFFD